MISTVVRNLCSNSIKFTPKNGTIRVSALEKENNIEVCISDTGIGISEKDIDKLFRIDVHHTTIGTSSEKGTGLGLILCKEFIEKNDGQIWVESTLGKGSNFKFILPKPVSTD
jgi:two-component system, sensor histidine kinase and response regulator